MFKAKEYVKAANLEEAWQLNQKKSSVVVGGMMWLKMSSLNKGTIIDLSGLGLDTIEETEEEFRIGCMCTLRDLELHEGLNEYFNGIFKECTKHIVGVQFRNGATVGGSVFGRYGFSDILTCLMALDTKVELYKAGFVSLETFAKMPYDRDILVRIVIRKDGRKAAYVTQRRTKTDFPLIACAASRLGDTWYFSVGARPAKAALVKMQGDHVNAAAAAGQFRYGDNMRGSGEYRRDVAEIYLSRLVRKLEMEA
ncbi:FAD binding domain-containing protein [Clostridium sp. AM58-1XD]|uniref:FAD binding domain-containing protein n=1 Tax=Clostridium sp. AM58-1XD TaxID=2292307 RepID=UPI000E5557C5|nr:FAD binding domain-containing protein [Clostridium sp. AM58-1XD]RGY97805.1 molybdopterin dehydrogenase [Clostridium sp. AM58-1XD]